MTYDELRQIGVLALWFLAIAGYAVLWVIG